MIRIHSIARQPSLQKKSEILLAAVIIARSTSLIFSRIALGSFGTFNLLALRFGAAFILLAAIFARRLFAIKAKELLAGVLLGVLFTAVLTLELFGLKRTDSGTTSFIENSAMIFVPVFQMIIFRKKPSGPNCIRIALALSGIGILTLGQSGGLFRSGSIYLIGAALCYAAVIMATAGFSKKYDPLLLGITQVGTVGILSFVLSLIFESPRLPESGREWLMILALAVVCSGFGFTLQPLAQRGTTAERAGMMCAVSPVSAAALGIIFLHEQISPYKAAGCALIMLSLVAEPLIKRIAILHKRSVHKFI